MKKISKKRAEQNFTIRLMLYLGFAAGSITAQQATRAETVWMLVIFCVIILGITFFDTYRIKK